MAQKLPEPPSLSNDSAEREQQVSEYEDSAIVQGIKINANALYGLSKAGVGGMYNAGKKIFGGDIGGAVDALGGGFSDAQKSIDDAVAEWNKNLDGVKKINNQNSQMSTEDIHKEIRVIKAKSSFESLGNKHKDPYSIDKSKTSWALPASPVMIEPAMRPISQGAFASMAHPMNRDFVGPSITPSQESNSASPGYQGSNVTVNNYYPIDPQTPNSRIYDQSGGQAYAGASNR